MTLERKINALRGAIPTILSKLSNEMKLDITVLAQSEMEFRDPIGKTKSGKKKYETPISSNILGIRQPKEGLSNSFFALVNGNSIEFGNKKPYAAVHEYGGNGIKPRPYFEKSIAKLTTGKYSEKINSIIFSEFFKAWNNA